MTQAHLTRRESSRLPRCGIAIMGKASTSGRAKTRLVPPLTPAQAARCNTAFLQDVAGNVLAASAQADIAAYVAYAPAGSEAFFREHLPAAVALFEMTRAGFGACLQGAVETLLARGHAAACVLNSDSPTLPTAQLVRAARLLEPAGDRVVLGPSLDGGYYLLGLKQMHAELFRDIDWSSAAVAAQTERRAAQLGVELIRLDAWYDVDDADSFALLQGELFEGRAVGRGYESDPALAASPGHDSGLERAVGYAAPHTRAVLSSSFEDTGLRSNRGPGSPVRVT